MSASPVVNRRTVLVGGAGATAAVLLGWQTAAAALPVVDMELLLAAAQIEPSQGFPIGIGAANSVQAVQSALDARGFATTADGWFGNETTASYAAWQESLGYSGLGANGLPGPTSLTELSADRYTIEHQILVGGMVTYTGVTLNERTLAMVEAANGILGWSLVLSQGSYNSSNPSSAGTHDGGGALDVAVSELTDDQRWSAVQALRTVGFAAWRRFPDQGDWPEHIHGMAVGDTDMQSPTARDQIGDYFVGLDGLAVHAPDNTPSEYQVPFTWWESYSRG